MKMSRQDQCREANLLGILTIILHLKSQWAFVVAAWKCTECVSSKFFFIGLLWEWASQLLLPYEPTNDLIAQPPSEPLCLKCLREYTNVLTPQISVQPSLCYRKAWWSCSVKSRLINWKHAGMLQTKQQDYFLGISCVGGKSFLHCINGLVSESGSV